MDDTIYIFPHDIEIVDVSDYCANVDGHFSSVPEVAKSLIKSAKATLNKIEKVLYSAPAFINVVKASIREETFQTILTFIKNQPESFWGKLISGAAPEKVNSRMNEIRESLCAVNMVSLMAIRI